MYFADNTVAAVRNGVRHGEHDTRILLTATIDSDNSAVFEVINRAGATQAAALALQEIHGHNFLMVDAADKSDLAHKGLGAHDSSYQGCCDIRKIAAAMGGEPALIFEPNTARFTLRLHGAVTGDTPSPSVLLTVHNHTEKSTAIMNHRNNCINDSHAALTNGQVLTALPAANSTIENGLSPFVHFLYADDSNAVRVQALKLAKATGIDIENGIWSKEELKGKAYRHEKRLRIWGRAASEVTVERFLAEAQEWKTVPAVIVLDQNIDFGHTIQLGTDICQAMRSAGFQGVILIRSGNDSADDRETYIDTYEADGMLQKTVKFTELVQEMQGWMGVAIAKCCAS